MNLFLTCFCAGCFFQYFAFNSSVVDDRPTFLRRTSQGNFYVTGTLNELMCYFLSTVCDRNVTVTGNIRTACSGVNITCRCIDRAIDHDFGIHKICIRSCIISAWSIAYRNKLLITRSGIITPFVCIVNIDVVTFAKCTFCIFTDDDFRTGEECNILIDRDITGYHFNRHVILNTQLIVLGVDAGGTDSHIDGGNGYIAISRDHQAVGVFVIILDNVAVCQVEHSSTLCNKCNRRTEILFRHENRGIRVFRRSGPDSQRNLDVLEIILGKREYSVIHIGGLGTAAEVHDLEVFIHLGTAVCNNRTAAGDETVCIKRTAVIDGDGAVLSHINTADRICGGTAVEFTSLCIIMFCRKADCTVNGNICTFCHGKHTISCGSRMVSEITHSRSCALCFRRIHGIRIIERNEQGHACGNGIFTCRKRSVVHQNDSLCGVCSSICSSYIQIVKEIDRTNFIVVKLAQAEKTSALRFLSRRTNAEPRCAAVLCKSSLNSHILCGNQSIGCSSRKNLTGCINPTNESGTTISSCREFYTGSTVYRQNSTVCNSIAACGYGTESAVKRNGYAGTVFYFNQADVAHCQCCSCIGKTAIGYQRDRKLTTCLQNHAVRTGSSRIRTCNLEGACRRRCIVKREFRFSAGVIGNSNVVRLLA